MKRRDYREILDQLRFDLAGLEREREDVEHRIAKLRQTVIMLGGLCDDPEPLQAAKLLRRVHKAGSLTDAVHSALMAVDQPMDAREIRDVLINLGHPFKSSNILASIYSVLKRLREREEVQLVSGPRVNEKGETYTDTAYWCSFVNELPEGWGIVPLQKSLKRTRKRLRRGG